MPIACASLRRKLALVFCAALVSTVESAHRAGAATPESSSGAGSTFSAPLYQQWIKVYQGEHPSVSITYDVVGSGEGVSRFVAGTVDFGASDVVLSDSEVAKVSQGVVMVPATAGIVVLAYNISGAQAKLRLPRDVYPGIFSGAIRRRRITKNTGGSGRIGRRSFKGRGLSHRHIQLAAPLSAVRRSG
jgi:ABC-type phosphate transport system substrate-binding protein